MASSKALVIQSGITKQIPNGDTLLVGVAIDAAVAGPLAVGGALATSLAIGDNAAVTSMTQGGGAGLTTLTIGGGANVAVLSIGSAMGAADAINIGGVGSLTTIKGNLQVDGTETVTGISTFNNNAIFNGDVTFGDAVTDSVTFTGRVAGSINFLKETSHFLAVDASTTASANGGLIRLLGGDGAASVGVAAGGVGGQVGGTAGVGGAGSGAFAGGAGGAVSLLAAAGGAAGAGAAGAGGNVTLTAGSGGAGGTGANGGNVNIDAGAAGAGGGTAGVINIGATTVSTLNLGNTTDNPATNILGTGTLTVDGSLAVFNGSVDLGNATSDTVSFVARVDTDVRFTPGAGGAFNRTLGPATNAASTAGNRMAIVGGTAGTEALGGSASLAGGNGGASVGVAVGGAAGDGSVAGGTGGVGSGAFAGGAGGNASVAGGTGGAGTAGASSGVGGYNDLRGGAEGAPLAGGGGGGGNLYLEGGHATVGAKGSIFLGTMWDTLTGGAPEIRMGNSTDNTIVTLFGTGQLRLSGGALRMADGAAPATAANTGAIYVKDSGGQSNLFFRTESSGTEYQLTPLAASSASKLVITGLTTAAMTASGKAGYVSANDTVTETDADVAASSRLFGFYEGTAGSMTIAGVVTPVYTGAIPAVGSPLYLDTATAGNVTSTAPTTAGQFVAEVGLVLNAATGTMLIQVKTVIAL